MNVFNSIMLSLRPVSSFLGSSLLELRDNFGRTPLDLVPSAALREELRCCAADGDSSSAAAAAVSDVQDLALVETCTCLLACLLLSYLQERDLPVCCSGGNGSGDPPLGFTPAQAQALPLLVPLLAASTGAKAPTATTTTTSGSSSSGWASARVAQLAHDLETLLGMRHHVSTLAPALKRCQGPHTQLLVQLLEDLQIEGQLLLNGEAFL